MKLSAIMRALVVGLIAIAVPGIACFGYYGLENRGDVSDGVATLIVFAYPAALIGLLSLTIAMLAVKRRPAHLPLAAACLLLSLVFLLSART